MAAFRGPRLLHGGQIIDQYRPRPFGADGQAATWLATKRFVPDWSDAESASWRLATRTNAGGHASLHYPVMYSP